ncbi:MAG: DUF2163 domain-containing protein [Pseudomonadota bacterium]
MNRFSPTLQAHLNGDATTTCTVWIVQLRDGRRLGFTDHDCVLTVDGVSCEPQSGFRATEAASSLGLAIDDQEIEGALSTGTISPGDVEAGDYDGAAVDIWLVNWANPAEAHRLRQAFIGEIRQSDGVFRADLEGLTSKLAAYTGRRYTRRCDALLGDGRCGLNTAIAAFSAAVTVSATVDGLPTHCVVNGADGFPEHWFNGGKISWTAGENAGRTSEVATFRDGDGTLDLWQAMVVPPSVGDVGTLFAGCDKSFATCKDKFANHLNFRGHPHVPGDDFVMGYADGNTVHDGSPIIP